MSVFNPTFVDAQKQTCFFGEPVNVARYDKPRYPQFEKLTDKQLGFFWQPEEVDISKDSRDFKALSEHEKHIFTSNLKRQILLDSVQGRAPSMAFLPICSNPELETWVQTWAFSETIHSKSYTYLIKNVYPNPSDVFDGMLDIEEIVDCAGSISKYYDDLIWISRDWERHPERGFWTSSREYQKRGGLTDLQKKHIYEMKTALWMCLNAVNALEGVRFYVSFACSWAFAEMKKMEGNAKIIKLICRDENIHLAGTQHLLKILPKEDKDFAKIQKEMQDEVEALFDDVAEQEKKWAEYLFKDGSMIGLNYNILCEYVDFITAKRKAAIGLGPVPRINPLPWTQKWISGSDTQVAPQQTQITSYVIGGTKKDVDEDSFKGFEL